MMLCVALFLSACTLVAPPSAQIALPQSATLIAVGDVASCESEGDEATARLLEALPGTIALLGDIAYQSGTAEEFLNCYDPAWGKFKDRTRPSPGNHEYITKKASAYYSYFGTAAGEPGKGYYSYDLGAWHIVALNSNCAKVGGCGIGSPQERWLRTDLEEHPASCTLAYWHHPRFSSGQHGNFESMQPIWQTLYNARVDLVLSGHDHNYERFAPQDPDGNADMERGIRAFVVGTGGKNHYRVGSPIANSEVREWKTFGVLRLNLHAKSYDWEFVPIAGKTFTDEGSDTCR